LRELRTLHLNSCNLNSDALGAFIGCTALPNLRHLNLQRNNITAMGAALLARADWLAQLDRLDVSGNALGDTGARALVDAGLFARHALLDLDAVGLTCDGLRAIGGSDQLGAVRELRASAVGGDPLEVVAEAPAFARLTALRLSGGGTGVTVAGVRALKRSPFASHLCALGHSYFLRAAVFLELLAARELSALRWLHARSMVGGDEPKIELGTVLRDATHLTNLHALYVDAGHFGDEALVALAGCAHFATLTDLNIRNGRVSAAGMDPFLESPHFARLRRVHLPLYSPKLNDPIRARIAARFGAGVYSYY
jgi:hypothetical protein